MNVVSLFTEIAFDKAFFKASEINTSRLLSFTTIHEKGFDRVCETEVSRVKWVVTP